MGAHAGVGYVPMNVYGRGVVCECGGLEWRIGVCACVCEWEMGCGIEVWRTRAS